MLFFAHVVNESLFKPDRNKIEEKFNNLTKSVELYYERLESGIKNNESFEYIMHNLIMMEKNFIKVVSVTELELIIKEKIRNKELNEKESIKFEICRKYEDEHVIKLKRLLNTINNKYPEFRKERRNLYQYVEYELEHDSSFKGFKDMRSDIREINLIDKYRINYYRTYN